MGRESGEEFFTGWHKKAEKFSLMQNTNRKISCLQVARNTLGQHDKSISRQTVWSWRIRDDLKRFHVISKLLKTATHVQDRLVEKLERRFFCIWHLLMNFLFVGLESQIINI